MLAPNPFNGNVSVAKADRETVAMFALGCALAALIFTIDLFLPLGVAGGVPYAGVVLIGLWSRGRPLIFALAGLGSVLTVLGYFYSPAGGEPWVVITNRGVAILIIWVVAIVLLQRKGWEDKLRQSEAQMRIVTDALPVLIAYVDADRRFRFVNQTAEAWYAKPRANIIGRTIAEVIGQAQADRAEPVLKRIERGGTLEQEFAETYSDGVTRMVKMNAVPDFDAGGKVRGHFALFQDVSQRKRAETALRKSEASLANAQHIAHIGNWDWEIPSGDLHWSDEIYRIFGLEPQGFGATYEAFLATIHPDDRTAVEEAVNAALDGHAPYSIDHRIVLASGEVRVVHEQAEVERDADGKPVAMRGTVQDITERKRAEAALKESEARFRGLAEGSMQGLLVTNVDAKPLFANRAAAAIFGYDGPEELLAMPSLIVLMDPEERDRMLERRQRLLATGGSPITEEVKGLRKDGSTVWVEDMRRRIEWEGQPAIQITFADITERKRIDAALKESEARLDAFFTNAPVGLVIWDDQQRYLKISDVLAEWNGMAPEDHIGKTIAEVFPVYEESGKASFQYIMETGKSVLNQEFAAAAPARPDSEITWLTSRFPIPGVTGKPVGVGSIVTDITEQKRAEEEIRKLNADLEKRVEKRTIQLRAAQSELVRKERLATLGQLSATISHELRNPLGTIRNSLVVLENKLGGNDPVVQRSVDRMVRNIGRCNGIIDEMLDFARARELKLKKTAFDVWLGRVLDELQVPPDVSVDRKLCAPKARLGIDDERMRRAIVNVYDNACQAMIEQPEGKAPARKKKVTVSTKATKGRLELAIADSGPGMPPEVLAAAFEPLYSTKGFGVGLGLPIVKQIMDQHGGGIEITSKHGSGARVVLWLPLGQSTTKTKKGTK